MSTSTSAELSELGIHPKSDRTEARADCPMCGGRDTLGVNTETGVWHCFKCHGAGRAGKGNVVDRSVLEARRQEKHSARERAAELCRRDWDAAAPVPWSDQEGAHPYLVRKGVEPIGVRKLRGSLLVPMRDQFGTLWSVQYIKPDGTKTFRRDARTEYVFHFLQGDREGIGIAEGYATAASILKLTGSSVYCTFCAGNMVKVAPIVRARHPDEKIIVWGDHDATKPLAKNVGFQSAKAAAKLIGGEALFPDFSRFDHHHPKPTDWNDYLLMEEGHWQ